MRKFMFNIIHYPLIDIFNACFVDCHFDETAFKPLREKKMPLEVRHELPWYLPTVSHLDPYIS